MAKEAKGKLDKYYSTLEEYEWLLKTKNDY